MAGQQAGRQADLGRLRRRVRLTRAVALAVAIGAVAAGTLFIRVDYADWATRPGVVRGSGSPVTEAATRYLQALVDWLSRPDPDTWQALADRVVLEKRGQAGGRWPWGPPVTVEAGLPVTVPLGATAWVTMLSTRLPAIPAGARRVTACDVEVGFSLTLFAATGERTEIPANMTIRLRFSDAERRWLVDP